MADTVICTVSKYKIFHEEVNVLITEYYCQAMQVLAYQSLHIIE